MAQSRRVSIAQGRTDAPADHRTRGGCITELRDNGPAAVSFAHEADELEPAAVGVGDETAKLAGGVGGGVASDGRVAEREETLRRAEGCGISQLKWLDLCCGGCRGHDEWTGDGDSGVEMFTHLRVKGDVMDRGRMGWGWGKGGAGLVGHQ